MKHIVIIEKASLTNQKQTSISNLRTGCEQCCSVSFLSGTIPPPVGTCEITENLQGSGDHTWEAPGFLELHPFHMALSSSSVEDSGVPWVPLLLPAASICHGHHLWPFTVGFSCSQNEVQLAQGGSQKLCVWPVISLWWLFPNSLALLRRPVHAFSLRWRVLAPPTSSGPPVRIWWHPCLPEKYLSWCHRLASTSALTQTHWYGGREMTDWHASQHP